MKLAFIIIPHETKLGSTEILLRNTIDRFYIEFGGCTHYPVTGICEGHSTGLSCEKIEVALEDNQSNPPIKFLEIAHDVAKNLQVDQIMIQHPDGRIMFLKGAN
tara:strand:- start:56 stop:367 length:312 start_codon:yes stop_codon:yes gene_type:complete